MSVDRSSGRTLHLGLPPAIVHQAFVSRRRLNTGEPAKTGQLRPMHYQIGRYAVVAGKLQINYANGVFAELPPNFHISCDRSLKR